MKKLLPLLCLALMAMFSSQANADVIAFEDFEDATLTYTGPADALGDILSNDYYGRLAPDTDVPPASISYSNLQGNGYYGVQDTDSAIPNPLDSVVLNWNGIDISNFENLNLSWFVAEDDDGTAQDWDTDTSFRIDVNIDGGGFNTVFAVESEIGPLGDQTNERPRVDTDLDGIGDGAEITDAFTQFSTALANGSTLDIRVTFEELNAGDEDFAFDNLLLEGDALMAVPEPTSVVMFGVAIVGLCLRRQRRD